jgi:curli biogenesis system outer membrane secretion channel CsgG
MAVAAGRSRQAGQEETTAMQRRTCLALALSPAVFASACASAPRAAQPQPQPQPQAPAPLAAGPRPAISIHEFRSSVAELSPRAATDLFATALVQSGRFTLVERARLNEGVLREKQLNAQGQTRGSTAAKPLREADYVLEGTLAEASNGAATSRTGVNVAGLQLGGSSQQDALALTVRLVAVDSGEVLHAGTVRRALTARTREVSGIATLAQTVAAVKGKLVSPWLPDVQHQSGERSSVDAVLEALVADAVAQLAALAPTLATRSTAN